MKDLGILAVEWITTGLIVFAGLSGKQILFINGPRSAVITLGAIGFIMCMVMPSVGLFVRNAPAHPVTIVAYIVGLAALFITLVQVFHWDIPVVNDPTMALYIVAGCIVVKSIIARCATLLF
jgi:hypothetical protein